MLGLYLQEQAFPGLALALAGLLPQGSLWPVIQGPQESLAFGERLKSVITIHLCRVPNSWDLGFFLSL